MKVYIGPYKNWIGPYQMAEKILFWLDKYKDDRVHNLGQWLAGYRKTEDEKSGNMFKDDEHKSLLYKFLLWIDSKKKRKVKIRIDKYDTWNMDATLSMIILPMLKQLKETKHGSPIVDLEDVPETMRTTDTEDYDAQTTFDFYHEPDLQKIQCDLHDRWNWVMDEMIWAFEQKQPDVDWEKQYYTGNSDYRWKKSEKAYTDPDTGKEECTYEMLEGPDHTQVIDWDGLKAHQARIDNGLRLFGKYFQGLWD